MYRTFASLFLCCAICLFALNQVVAVTIPIVPIGDLGNTDDPLTGNQYGAVDYQYSIGTTEITVGQYTAFLNAIAADDYYLLYDSQMTSNLHVSGIARSGSAGNYSYSVIGSPDKPVTYINWGDAARFANWMHNGQPHGAQNTSSTEGGSYTMNGAWLNDGLKQIQRNSGATWVIPTIDEWYKAAYYQPGAQGGDTDSYWAYPTRSNTQPDSDQPPGLASIQANAANLYRTDAFANGFNDGYAVTGSTTLSSTQNYLTDAGAYQSTKSYYGTFDQAGNVSEWTDSPLDNGENRGRMGGDWLGPLNPAHQFSGIYPFFSGQGLGLRVARLGDNEAVTTVNSPTTVDFGGGAGITGGVEVGFTPTSPGTFQEFHYNTLLTQLPNSPAFLPGNFVLIAPGDRLQYWDLHYTGNFVGTATVSFTFDPSLVIPNTPIGIWHFAAGNGGWEFLGGTIVGNTITVTTNSFSPFALANAPVPEPACLAMLGIGAALLRGTQCGTRRRT